MLRYLGFRKSFDIGQLVEKKLVEKKLVEVERRYFGRRKAREGRS